ncbi:MAG: 23S rRNA (adenine(2503)-C(2))-methyltransferase RlmN [Bacteroidales bacterium]|nr:23S rRNA (adenine(2503)-C(2))-methyltransferase RlmN [Bacteroidales bacterium]
MDSRTDILGLSLAELEQLCSCEVFPKYTAKQICQWLYNKRVSCIDDMTNLSKTVRGRLKEIAYIGRRVPVQCRESADGTKKYLFELSENRGFVESVFIPDEDRATLCVSSQVGCKMGCHFCATGRMGFHGNLTPSDILNQFFSVTDSHLLTNVVFMGMGEPMDNLDAVLKVCEVATADWGMGWSPKRITVSTVGIVPGIRRFLEQSRCHLAVSLHNAFADERVQSMPVEKAYPASSVVSLLRQYDWSGQRRLSFEYTMLKGINDDRRHAEALLKLLSGLECRVNLIRFHSSKDAPYQTSDMATITAFRDFLNAKGVRCTLRASRGEDIEAACGLLATQRALDE